MVIEYKEKRYELVETCMACPEQYDVFELVSNGSLKNKVGYIRMRHGNLTVNCPDYSGRLVYKDSPDGDGCFEEEERDFYLMRCIASIYNFYSPEREMTDEELDEFFGKETM